MNAPTSDTPPSSGLTPDGVSRRAALVVPAGAGVLALSACGGSSEGGGAGGEAAGPIELPSSDVPVGGGVVREGVVVTQPTEGEFHAFDALCPHQGCAVNEVSDDAIRCPCHGSAFSLEDGSVVNTLRASLPPAQARAFARRCETVVHAGRPACPFCGGPVDADGHICPRANGYKR